MNKLIFISIALLQMVVLPICGYAQKLSGFYVVKGELEDTLSNGKMIYISRYDDHKILDSTKVVGNKFSFTGKVDIPSMCRIDVTRRAFGNFILEKGTIQVNLKEYNKPSGTPFNELMSVISAEEDSMGTVISCRRKELKEQYPDVEEYEKRWLAYMDTIHYNCEQRCKELYKEHDNDAIGFYLLYTQFMKSLRPEVQEAIMNSFGPWLKSTNLVYRGLALLSGQKNTAEGKPFIDIKGKSVDGKDIALSDFVGKGNYVLIDMWASWCGPCRGEVPNLALLHNRYKDKGLTVVGIFVWDEESNLKQALADEKITWPQIIDTEKKAMNLYGVRGIPQIILFAPNGTIIKRNLRGENMIRTIDKIMSNK